MRIAWIEFVFSMMLLKSIYAQSVVYELINTSKSVSYFRLPHKFSQDSATRVRELEMLVGSLHRKGFLLANLDTYQIFRDTLRVRLHIGERYRGMYLNVSQISSYTLQNAGLSLKSLQRQWVTPHEWNLVHRKLLAYSENHGFPFAEVKLDSVHFQNGRLYANLYYQPYFQVLIDTILCVGDAKIRPSYWYSLTGISPGSIFSQKKITYAQQTLKQQPYLRILQEPIVSFYENKAQVRFFANQRKANQFDGIIGILPNAQDNTRTVITGQIDVKLHHLLYSGKHIALKWQRMNQEMQVLNVYYAHPYFLKTALTIGGTLNILRQDSSFQNVLQELRLSYPTLYIGKISVLVRRFSSSAPLKTRSSDLAKIQIISYGVGYQIQQLDDIFFPKKGTYFKADILAGNKQTTQFLLDTTLQTTSLQIGFEAELSRYFQQSNNTTLLVRWRGAWIENQNLFLNDLYRIGGINSLRGFNENTFFTQWHHILTIEQRFYTNEESFFFLFSDGAYLRNNIRTNAREQTVWSVGSGVSIAIKAGVFSLAYAIGKSDEQEFHPRFSKIHIGLINRF